MSIADLPHLNAGLNAASAVLLTAGYWLMRHGRIRAHATAMISATALSAVFLCGYLFYHYHHGETRVGGMDWVPHWLKITYWTILLPHLLLAMAMLPLIGITLWHAGRRQLEQHRRIAPTTLCIWLYVSVTGVIIYWMLYHLFPSMKH